MKKLYCKLSATTLGAAVTLAVAAPSSLATSFSLSQSFFNPNPDRLDTLSEAFGSEVAIDGDKVLIGARYDDTFGSSSGAAYLFDAVSGNLTQTFFQPDLDVGDTFGTAVAIDGDKVLIGAAGESEVGSGGGAAFLFDAVSGNLIQSFFSSNNSVIFGSSVAIDGDKVLIGDSQNDTFAKLSGAAFLFDAVSGDLTQSFFHPNPDEPRFNVGDAFGASVAINEDKVLIGAPGDDTFGFSSGSAFLFDALSGNIIQTFFDPNPGDEDVFGSSVAIEGDKVLISAIFDDTFGFNSGAAFLFDALSGNLIQTFLDPNPDDFDFFGTSVAIDGDKVLIGARGDDTFGNNSGAAYLFDAVSGNLIQSFFAPNPDEDDDFGFSVAIFGDNLLIGAPGDDEGAAFLFQAASSSVPEPGTALSLGIFGLALLLRKKLVPSEKK
jgi:hypothetical protein